MAMQPKWGVRITQAGPGVGDPPPSYWWQGPHYRGDEVMTRGEAEVRAAEMRSNGYPWRYEARPYVSK